MKYQILALSLAVLVLGLVAFDSVDAYKSKGTYLSETNSDKVCGDRLCSETDPTKDYMKSGATDAQIAQEMVYHAIGVYDEMGTAAFEKFNDDPSFRSGEHYVYAVRASDDVIVAIGTAHQLLGKKVTSIYDSDGINIGDLFKDNVTPEGVWVHYKFKNPADGKVEPKSSWIIEHDGYIFGSGYYDTSAPLSEHAIKSTEKQRVQDLVASAVSLYDEIGIASFDDIDTSAKLHDGELYVFVNNYDTNIVVAHGEKPSLIGTNIADVLDANGNSIGEIIHDGATPDGAWVKYMWEGHDTGKVSLKKSWVVLHDGYVFGSGFFAHGDYSKSDYSKSGHSVKPEVTDAPLSLLFVQMANSGTFMESDDGYTLTLVDVNSQTIYFSDRPNRISGHMTTADYVNNWGAGDDSFASDPPNAAVTILDADESEDTIIVELSNPVYDAGSMTLQYTAQIIADASDGLSHYVDSVDESIPESFGNVAVFIDVSESERDCNALGGVYKDGKCFI